MRTDEIDDGNDFWSFVSFFDLVISRTILGLGTHVGWMYCLVCHVILGLLSRGMEKGRILLEFRLGTVKLITDWLLGFCDASYFIRFRPPPGTESTVKHLCLCIGTQIHGVC